MENWERLEVCRCGNTWNLPKRLMHRLTARGLSPGANAGIASLRGYEV